MRKITPIQKSLYTPQLFAGCERMPFIFVATLGLVLLYAYETIVAGIAVFIFYTVSITLIRRVNKMDPQYFKCLWRFFFYFQEYYPAHELYPGKPDKPRSFFGKY
jgi:type IV secretory pathway TrbD component